MDTSMHLQCTVHCIAASWCDCLSLAVCGGACREAAWRVCVQHAGAPKTKGLYAQVRVHACVTRMRVRVLVCVRVCGCVRLDVCKCLHTHRLLCVSVWVQAHMQKIDHMCFLKPPH